MTRTIGRCRRRRIGGFLAIMLALVSVSAGAGAGGQAQEAIIIGQVTDESGGVLPGVTVTAESAPFRSKFTSPRSSAPAGTEDRAAAECL